nr:hypothetical protein Iba_chr07fCG8250 [Ipomoea batatas]
MAAIYSRNVLTYFCLSCYSWNIMGIQLLYLSTFQFSIGPLVLAKLFKVPNYLRELISITSMEQLLTHLLMFVTVQKKNQLRIYLISAIHCLNTPVWMAMELFRLNQQRLITSRQWKGWECVLVIGNY